MIILLTLFVVLMAGCTSKAPEQAPPDLPTTAHAVTTLSPTPLETLSSKVPETVSPASKDIETVSALSSPSIQTTLSEGGISLTYPDRFRLISNSSLEKMRAVAEPQGISIISILSATDSKDSIQVTRQDADTTIEGMYADKMAISQEITANGSATVMAMTFVKYEVEKQSLADGTGVVKVLAENSEDGTAVTYLLCKPGSLYNINFIYESLQRAESQASARDAIIQTAHLV